MDTYTFHHDPGHGWLEVSQGEIDRLGLREKITPFSYVKGERVFLEEDCDQVAFLNEKRARGEEMAVRDEYYPNEAPCRFYRDYPYYQEKTT